MYLFERSQCIMIKIGEKKIYKNFKVRKPLEIEVG